MIKVLLAVAIACTSITSAYGMECNFGFEQLSCRYQSMNLFAYETQIDKVQMEITLNGDKIFSDEISCQQINDEQWSFYFPGFETTVESSISLNNFRGYGFDRISTEFSEAITFDFCDVD